LNHNTFSVIARSEATRQSRVSRQGPFLWLLDRHAAARLAMTKKGMEKLETILF